jgi:hypothetical protein
MTVSAVNQRRERIVSGLAACFLFTHDRHVLAAALNLPAQL